jgi:formylglycine-generating enzyme required for sulfatase activity
MRSILGKPGFRETAVLLVVTLGLLFGGCQQAGPGFYTVSGIITTDDPGGAASGASVQLKHGVINVGGAVSTNGSGAYTIPDVPERTGYTIEVFLTGYTTGVSSPFDVTADVTDNDLTLAKITGTVYTVSGTITTDDPGGPASGASVQLKQGGTNVGSAVSTDAGGAYTISDVPEGTGYTIEVSLTGYTTGVSSSFDVTADVTDNDLTLAKITVTVYTVGGTITTDDPGGPASGASVQLKQGGTNVGSAVSTDAGGTYTISDVPEGTGYTIEVSLAGYTTGTISSFNIAADVTGKDLTLFRRIVYTVDGVTFKMALVPGGLTFPAGAGDSGSAMVANPYEIGETEVTYELWHKVRSWAESNGYTFYNNPGREGSSSSSENTTPSGNKQEPVTMVSWFDVVVWLNALTEWVNAKTGSSLEPVYYYDSTYAADKMAKNSNFSLNFVKESSSYNYASAYAKPGATGFRLPSSNEWELAARWRGSDSTNTVSSYTDPYFTKGNSASGATASYSDTAATGAVAWYDGNASGKTQTVKGKLPNALGLYDMSGNVFEWCFDWYLGFIGGNRIVRGGTWNNGADYLQVSGIIGGVLGNKGGAGIGFRPARTAP